MTTILKAFSQVNEEGRIIITTREAVQGKLCKMGEMSTGANQS